MTEELQAGEDRRQRHTLRADLNQLVRDDKGWISGSKIGTYIGQGVAIHMLLSHTETVLKSWDILTVLFTVMLAPEMWKRLMEWRFGGAKEK